MNTFDLLKKNEHNNFNCAVFDFKMVLKIGQSGGQET
jgi:hypothetical protein